MILEGIYHLYLFSGFVSLGLYIHLIFHYKRYNRVWALLCKPERMSLRALFGRFSLLGNALMNTFWITQKSFFFCHTILLISSNGSEWTQKKKKTATLRSDDRQLLWNSHARVRVGPTKCTLIFCFQNGMAENSILNGMFACSFSCSSWSRKMGNYFSCRTRTYIHLPTRNRINCHSSWF